MINGIIVGIVFIIFYVWISYMTYIPLDHGKNNMQWYGGDNGN